MLIENKITRTLLWVVITIYLFWHLFITVIVLNPMGLLPISCAVCAAVLLNLQSFHLRFVLHVWAIYLLISSALKLLGAYMQSIGSITYDWTTWGLFRNVLFICLAIFFIAVARTIEEVEEEDVENGADEIDD